METIVTGSISVALYWTSLENAEKTVLDKYHRGTRVSR